MQSELELDDDSEVAATAAQTPEQVGVLIGGRAHGIAVRGDDGVGHAVGAGEPVLARQPAHAAAQCQPAGAGVRDIAGRCGEAEGLRGTVQGAEHRAALHPGAPRDRIDGDTAQLGEVDHEPAVRTSEAGDVVAAATDTDLQAALTGGDLPGVSRGVVIIMFVIMPGVRS